MSEFVELNGISGAAYRYRYYPAPLDLPAVAGTYLVLQTRGEGWELKTIGALGSLALLARDWPAGADERVYLRLNVARAGRRQEFDDLIAAYPASLAAPEPDWR